jgi:hypothetical protein
MAMMTASSYGLNPIRKEIYFSPRNNKDGTQSIQVTTSFEVFLQRARASNKLV